MMDRSPMVVAFRPQLQPRAPTDVVVENYDPARTQCSADVVGGLGIVAPLDIRCVEVADGGRSVEQRRAVLLDAEWPEASHVVDWHGVRRKGRRGRRLLQIGR